MMNTGTVSRKSDDITASPTRGAATGGTTTVTPHDKNTSRQQGAAKKPKSTQDLQPKSLRKKKKQQGLGDLFSAMHEQNRLKAPEVAETEEGKEGGPNEEEAEMRDDPNQEEEGEGGAEAEGNSETSAKESDGLGEINFLRP